MPTTASAAAHEVSIASRAAPALRRSRSRRGRHSDHRGGPRVPRRRWPARRPCRPPDHAVGAPRGREVPVSGGEARPPRRPRGRPPRSRTAPPGSAPRAAGPSDVPAETITSARPHGSSRAIQHSSALVLLPAVAHASHGRPHLGIGAGHEHAAGSSVDHACTICATSGLPLGQHGLGRTLAQLAVEVGRAKPRSRKGSDASCSSATATRPGRRTPPRAAARYASQTHGPDARVGAHRR